MILFDRSKIVYSLKCLKALAQDVIHILALPVTSDSNFKFTFIVIKIEQILFLPNYKTQMGHESIYESHRHTFFLWNSESTSTGVWFTALPITSDSSFNEYKYFTYWIWIKAIQKSVPVWLVCVLVASRLIKFHR